VGNIGDNFVDESGSQAWPGGWMEPGPHTYNVFTGTLRMSNSFSASRVKILLLRIVWAPSTESPPPIIQSVGSVLDQALWPRATPLNADGTPVLDGEGNQVRAEIQAASVEVSSAGAIVATMRFLFDPQPAGETIRLPNGFIENRYPAAIGAQTICIPTPATAALAGAGVLFAAGRRRR
jgi:uncharacterized protein (TIGR03382 family)